MSTEDMIGRDPGSSFWRIRDAAEDLLDIRGALGPDLRSVPRRPEAPNHVEMTMQELYASGESDETVRQAFDFAAKNVIKAVELAKKQSPPLGYKEEDLPAILHEIKELEVLKEQSFDRSHDNKEYSKRKGGKTEASLVAERVKVVEGPKFTRNTPASSAAALESRLNSSRAILCAAGNVVFNALTPGFDGKEIDVLDIPQNATTNGNGNKESDINMGAVGLEAKTVAERAISLVENATRRSSLRYKYRKDNLSFDRQNGRNKALPIAHPFAWKDDDEEDITSFYTEDDIIQYQPDRDALTECWITQCLPRMKTIASKGSGHLLYHDQEWSTRHGRIGDFLRSMTTDNNFGPHLIITTTPDVKKFSKEFQDFRENMSFGPVKDQTLKVLAYDSSSTKRRTGLRRFFSSANGLPESPFHVLVTSYENFFQDYLHFCQIPFENVVVDDGASWMAAAQGDVNSALGCVWKNAMWSTNDNRVGLAGTTFKEWDFAKVDFDEATIKEAWVGLTTRHRILTASATKLLGLSNDELLSISSLLNFVAPNFADVVYEDWERSRITNDEESKDHFRGLLARVTVVHSTSTNGSMPEDLALGAIRGTLPTPTPRLTLGAMRGALPMPNRDRDPVVPTTHSDDAFASSGKMAFTKRASLSWLGYIENSWLRYELGQSKLQDILDFLKVSSNHGHLCEEITTASSTTTTGATGQVVGSMAYRLAVRCGRHFGSEQGLRQHISALHAPPGTWLCRTCGSDCIYNQARTHHERSCGQPISNPGGDSTVVGAPPKVGQGISNKTQDKKKKPGRKVSAAGTSVQGEKDDDGAIRVPGFRGVWIDKKGKYFVKIANEKLKDDSSKLILFDDDIAAAKRYDEETKKSGQGDSGELNFKDDGTRNVFDDVTPASISGLAGSAANVVPALSMINIKDLPPDVKPLLRDPRQTSRTGGNSKRHVYAYRGVCRQARKGHDRWQSQISFMGVNHYLGTYDSEWDAAAIYAWAHLVLYGEEATRQAQKEGEEAAAAYEKEKQDIAAGKIPDPAASKKRKKEEEPAAPINGEAETKVPKKRKISKGEKTEKKVKLSTKGSKIQNEPIGPTLAKGVSKATLLGQREAAETESASDLQLAIVSTIDTAKHGNAYFDEHEGDDTVRPNISKSEAEQAYFGRAEVECNATLVGIGPLNYDWNVSTFIERSGLDVDSSVRKYLDAEYGKGGMNEVFKSYITGTVSIIGQASHETQLAYKSLGRHGVIAIGGSIGMIDCHIGGTPGSCGETGAMIRFDGHVHEIMALEADDKVSINGKPLQPSSGFVRLGAPTILSVGCRVFLFIPNT